MVFLSDHELAATGLSTQLTRRDSGMMLRVKTPTEKTPWLTAYSRLHIYTEIGQSHLEELGVRPHPEPPSLPGHNGTSTSVSSSLLQ